MDDKSLKESEIAKSDSRPDMSPSSLPRHRMESAIPVATATNGRQQNTAFRSMNRYVPANWRKPDQENVLGGVDVNTEDIPNLDFLRACAVLFVLGYHLYLYFQLTIPGPLKFYNIGQWDEIFQA